MGELNQCANAETYVQCENKTTIFSPCFFFSFNFLINKWIGLHSPKT